MILSCNSCEKKFVVPDAAIGASGRLVQCSSCGNKWKQYPIVKKNAPKEKISGIKPVIKKTTKIVKKIKKKPKKKSGPDLYSPEYLAKKHGIKINVSSKPENKIIKNKTKVVFGFYSTLLIVTVALITCLRLLHFSQDLLINIFPVTEIYIEYLFESIKNIRDIIENFILGY